VAESLTQAGLAQSIQEAESSGKKGVLINVATRLVSWWYRSDPDEKALHARFVLLSPTGERLLIQSLDKEWADDILFLRATLRFDRMPVTSLGLCWLVVEQQKPVKGKAPRWVTQTRIPLHIQDIQG
jgi:hypothetical protein